MLPYRRVNHLQILFESPVNELFAPLRCVAFREKRLGFPLDAIPPVNPMVTTVQSAH